MGKPLTNPDKAARGHGLLSMEYLRPAAELLKCLAHPVRLRIVEILLSGEYTVDQIAGLCGASQPATSGHLRLMEGKGLLSSERRGRTVYYSVAETRLRKIIACLREGYAGQGRG